MQTNQPYTIQISSKLVLYMAFKSTNQAKLSKFGHKKSTRQKKTTLDTEGVEREEERFYPKGQHPFLCFVT